MKKLFTLSLSIFLSVFGFSQTVSSLISQVSKTGVIQTVKDLSGENPTVVEGSTVTIKNRVSSKGNNVAASYIKEHLNSYGITAVEVNYSSGGRNIVATKTGALYPTKKFVICAHYDAVSDYGADDNASGVAAVLEAARIMSNYTFEYTVVFALWDEEEIGLYGAKNYASTAKQNGDNIIAVVNMDMIGYDGDNDKRFDIDVRNIANSYQIKNDLLSVVSTHGLNLTGFVVDPGTLDSDHSAFWTQGYSAVLLGEAWSKNDITPGYHSSNDRLSYFNTDYFYNMVKLAVGYIVTKAVLMNGTGVNNIDFPKASVYPNPVQNNLHVDLEKEFVGKIVLLNMLGEEIYKQDIQSAAIELNMESYVSGLYFMQLIGIKEKGPVLKVLKE